MTHLSSGIIRAAAGLLASGTFFAATAQDLSPVPAEDANKLGGLIGTGLTAKPAKERHVLVFWRCEGFVHGSAIAYGNKALELAAAQTKAFAADFSKDYAALRPENLARYDALVLNNTTTLNTPENPWLEAAVIDFVKSGKGLAVIHSGADNFYKAERAAEMVGGRFWGHPWGGGGTWAFKLDDPNNALNKAFGGKNFSVGEEVYQQQSPFYLRAKLHVLVSLDLADKATADAQGQRRADKDNAVSWIRPYGKGRVFYTSFGHDQRAFLNPATLTHILDGVQYALGDLKADDTPAGLSDADLNAVKTATDANVNETFAFLQEVLAHTGHAKTDAANKAKLEALLKDPATTPFGKKAILRALLAVGGAEDLAAVTACLKIPEARDWAAAVLAGTRGPAADKAIAQALADADAELRCSLLYALGVRKNADALAPYAADKDAAVATAALSALGRIGSEAALRALEKPAASPALEDLRQTALAACLGTLAENGQAKAAARAAKTAFANAAAPAPLRAAAARALLLADPGFFADGLKDACPMVRQTVVRAADKVSVQALADALKGAAPADQVALLAKLAARDAKACAPAAAALLKSDQEAVVCAALAALVKIGGADQVPALFELTSRDGAIGGAATDALNNLRAADAGPALIALAEKRQDQQIKVLGILAARSEAALAPKLEAFLKSEQTDVRKEAWKALGKLADDKTFPQLVAWLALVKSEEMNPAESAVLSVAKNVEPATRTAAFAGAWAKAAVPAKKTLASLMATYADPAFVPLLGGALSDPDNGLRESALNALADWLSMAPYDTLKAAISGQSDAGLKHLALRGALKLAVAHAGGDTRTRCIELFKAVADDKERATVADALFRKEGLEVFPILQGLAGDPACGAAAKKIYVDFYDQKLKHQAGQPSRDLDPKAWKANASHAGGDAARAFDRNADTRWSSNTQSVKGMWYTLDLGESYFVSEVLLDTEKSGGDTPNGYEVYVSNDGNEWNGPVAKGDGNTHGKTNIPLGVQTRHLKFVTTDGRPGLHWSIHEIYVKAGLDQKKVEEIGKIADTLR